MPADCITRALTLRRVDYGEADRILTLLTEDYGQRAVFARGVRKSSRRLSGATEPFRLFEAHYRDRNRRTGGEQRLGRMTDAKVIESFDGISDDLHRMSWASLALGWTCVLVMENEPTPIFETLIKLLRWLSNQRPSAWQVEAGHLRYGLLLLASAGFMPTLTSCSRTGVRLSDISHPRFAAGGLLTSAASRPEDRAIATEREVVEFLVSVTQGKFPSEQSVALLRQARRLVFYLLDHTLDRQPRAFALVKSMWL